MYCILCHILFLTKEQYRYTQTKIYSKPIANPHSHHCFLVFTENQTWDGLIRCFLGELAFSMSHLEDTSHGY